MQKPSLTITSIVIILSIFFCSPPITAQTTQAKSSMAALDLKKAGKSMDEIDKKFTNEFRNGDSVALASHYAKDGKFGDKKGKDILSLWGILIQNSIKDSARNLLFTTISIMGDSEFLFVYGRYEQKGDHNNLKGEGKYIVVLKQENGEWKFYRDNGL